MKNVIIVGSSGHASSMIDLIDRMGGWRVVGLLDSFAQAGTSRLGYEIVGKPEDIATVAPRYSVDAMLVAIGDNFRRRQVANDLRIAAPDLPFITAIDPTVVVGRNTRVGAGTVVMAGAVISGNVSIGKSCIVSFKASVGHDDVLGDFVSVAPGVSLGGDVAIGELSAICIGATVVNRVRIGKETVLGAGSTLLGDLDDNVLAYGTPARRIRARAADEQYL